MSFKSIYYGKITNLRNGLNRTGEDILLKFDIIIEIIPCNNKKEGIAPSV